MSENSAILTANPSEIDTKDEILKPNTGNVNITPIASPTLHPEAAQSADNCLVSSSSADHPSNSNDSSTTKAGVAVKSESLAKEKTKMPDSVSPNAASPGEGTIEGERRTPVHDVASNPVTAGEG